MEYALPSQCELKPYGHVICTPMCVLVGARFVHGEFERLTAGEVRVLLAVAHRLYSEHFAERRLPMKLHDLLPLLPPQHLQWKETAGQILRASSTDVECSGLVVAPLLQLLLQMAKESGSDARRQSLMVTTQDHTLCYWADERGALSVFDPLPAYVRGLRLSELAGWLQARYCCSNAEEDPLYSGLWLAQQAAP
jgi:hypothetical protein